jgi:hypothetical protein
MTASASSFVTLVDVAADVRPHLGCLQMQSELPITDIIRYYALSSEIPGKILTPIEAQAIADAGFGILPVWENGPANTPEYFTRAHGYRDGQGALALAKTIGQPTGSSIFYAVDCDVGETTIRAGVAEYFQGLWSSGVASHYAIGVYGSGMTCRLLQEVLGLTEYTWLAQSDDWAESKTYAGWVIKQAPQRVLCGLTCDVDTALAGAYGSFRLPGTPA